MSSPAAIAAYALGLALNSVLKSRLFWFVGSVSVSTYLVAAPIFEPANWNARRQLLGFAGLTVTLPTAFAASRRLEYWIVEVSVDGRMRHLHHVSETVHVVNFQRAVQAKQLRLINGSHTMAELQEMMSAQVQQMTEAIQVMKATVEPAELPAGEVEALQVVDVAALIANTVLDSDNGGSVLIAAPRRTGKSNLQRAAMHCIHLGTAGAVDFVAFAGKSGEKFCGLERSAADYMFSGSSENSAEACDRFEVYAGLCERRNGSGLPTIILSDEHNHTLGAAAQSGLKKNDVPIVRRIANSTHKVVTQGPSKRVNAILTSHSPLVQDIGLNTQIQKSVKTLVLGSPVNWEGLEEVLQGEGKLIRSRKQKQALSAQFEAYKEQGAYLCLHNLEGNWQLCALPNYPDTPGDLAFGIQDLSLDEEELIDYFEQPDGTIDIDNMTEEEINDLIERRRTKRPEPAADAPADLAQKFVTYFHEKGRRFADVEGWVNVSKLQQHWGKPNNLSAKQFRIFLNNLAALGVGKFHPEDPDFFTIDPE